MKKVLILSTSLRNGSNSEILAKEFERGAKENNEVKFISLKNKTINFCIGCLTCQNTRKCVLNDDMLDILNDILDSDVLVFATPIYYYEMSGAMKTLIDRINPIYGTDYKFKEVYLIATAADNAPYTFDRCISGLEGFIECFENSKLVDVIKGFELSERSEANNNEELLNKAYELGKNI